MRGPAPPPSSVTSGERTSRKWVLKPLLALAVTTQDMCSVGLGTRKTVHVGSSVGWSHGVPGASMPVLDPLGAGAVPGQRGPTCTTAQASSGPELLTPPPRTRSGFYSDFSRAPDHHFQREKETVRGSGCPSEEVSPCDLAASQVPQHHTQNCAST